MRFHITALLFFVTGCASGGAPPASSADTPPPAETTKRPPRRPGGAGGGAGKSELEEAKKLAGVGELDAAIAKAREVIAKNPQIEEAYLLWGSACAMKDDSECEAGAYQAGLDSLPSSPQLHNATGLLSLRNGKAKEALGSLAKAHELSLEKDAKIAADYAYALSFNGKLDEAEKMAKTARALDPKSLEAAMALGEVLLRKKEGDGAVKAFEEAMKLNEDPEVKRNLVRQLAHAHAIAGNQEEALQLYRSLLDGEEQNDPMLHTQIAASLIALKRAKEAVTSMEAAVKLAPNDARFLGLLMKAQEEAGDKKAAKATKKRLDSLR